MTQPNGSTGQTPSPLPAYEPNRIEPGLTPDERQWAVGAHLVPFLSAWIAISPIGPYVVYLMTKDKPFANEAARRSFNYNLTMWIGVAISLALIPFLVGMFTLPIFGLMMLVGHIKGATVASNGGQYDYPLSYQFLK